MQPCFDIWENSPQFKTHIRACLRERKPSAFLSKQQMIFPPCWHCNLPGLCGGFPVSDVSWLGLTINLEQFGAVFDYLVFFLGSLFPKGWLNIFLMMRVKDSTEEIVPHGL